jgi:hypothetical protein
MRQKAVDARIDPSDPLGSTPKTDPPKHADLSDDE